MTYINSFHYQWQLRKKNGWLELRFYHIIIIAIFTLAISSNCYKPAFAQYPPPDNLPLYEINVQLDNQSYTLSGSVKITYPNPSASSLSEIFFQLAPNTLAQKDPRMEESRYDYFYPKGFNPGWIKILSAKDEQGNSLRFTYKTDQNLPLGCAREQALLQVTLPKPLPPKDKYTFILHFQSKVPEMYAQGHYRQTLYLQGFWYPGLLSYRLGKWITGLEEFPPAYYHLTFTVPSEEIPVSSAAWEKIERHSNGITTYYGECGPIPSLALASSRKYHIEEGESEGVMIKSYSLPRDIETAKACLQYAAEAIRFIRRELKLPLTFTHLAIVDLYMGDTAAAYASGNAIFIPRELHKFPGLLKRLVESIVVHEVSHMWWGIGFTYNFDKDNWLGEGLATYTSRLYFEKKYGQGKNALSWTKWLPNMDYGEYFTELPYREQAVRDQDRPITESAKATHDLNSLIVSHYYKGAMIQRMLHYLLGEEKYVSFLQTLIRKYFAKVVTTRQMLSLCQQVADQDLTWFFNQWIYSTQKLDYGIGRVSTHKAQTGTATYIQVLRYQEAIMPIELKVLFQDGTDQTIRMEGKEKQETVTLQSKSEIIEAHLDPRHILPDIDRSNNHYRRKVRFYPVFDFPDSDSYLVTAMPFFSFNATDNQLLGCTLTAGYLRDWQLTLSIFYKQEPGQVGFMSFFYKDRLFSPNLGGIIALSDVRGMRGGSAGVNLTLYESHQQTRLPANSFHLSYNYQDAYYLSEEEKQKAEQEKTISEGKIQSIKLDYLRDARLNPLKGLHLEGGIEVGAKGMGGDFDFEQYQFDGRYFFHVYHLSSLMVRFFGGVTHGQLPLQKRFSLAGPTMLRGYNFDADYLGSNIVSTNIELNIPIRKNFQRDVSIKKYFWLKGVNAAFYYDGGKVWAWDRDEEFAKVYDWHKDKGFRKSKYRHNIGGAVILRTSFFNYFPLDWRIDVAFPLDHDHEREEDSMVIWFLVENPFF